MSSTTLCNQQRLHKGYHYPRSEETAKQSRDSEPSFVEEFSDAIMDTETYYSIGNKDSMVDSKQFEKFIHTTNSNIYYASTHQECSKKIKDMYDLKTKMSNKMQDVLSFNKSVYQKNTLTKCEELVLLMKQLYDSI